MYIQPTSQCGNKGNETSDPQDTLLWNDKEMVDRLQKY